MKPTRVAYYREMANDKMTKHLYILGKKEAKNLREQAKEKRAEAEHLLKEL
jgi:hypothetical protein